MSDAVLEQPRTNGQAVTTNMVEAAAAPNNGFDIIQVLWRWKWLPILGSLIGAGLGFLYFSQQPATYEAVALVQVINTMPIPTRNQFFDPMDKGITRADESMVIRSQAVLSLAVENGNLGEGDNTEFANLTVDQIVGELMKKKSPLVIEPADKDDNTTLIHISYVSEDADFAARVVTSIVDGYSQYLEKEYRDVGYELTSLLTKAKETLETDYNRHIQKMMDYQRQHPDVLWNGANTSDHFAEKFRELDNDLTQLRIKRQGLETTYNRAKAAIEADRPVEPILLMLMASEAGNAFTAQENWYDFSPLEKSGPEMKFKIDTPSRRIEQEQLYPAEIELRVLMDRWGDGHPSVAAMRKKIDLVKRQIEEMRETERRLDGELERIKQEAAASGAALSIEQRLSSRMNALAEQIKSFQEQEQNLQVMAQENHDNSKSISVHLNAFKFMSDELDRYKELMVTYSEKIKDLDLMPKVGQRTLKRLNMPSTGAFYGPKIPIYLLGGAGVGFILLSGLAVLMDLADRSYRNPSEIASDLNVNVLGHIPVMDISKAKKSKEGVDASVCTIHHGKGRVSEAYRTVRTGLYFNNRGKALKVLQVTSPVPGDGKSTLSCNLAVTMAQSGRRVLLIDGDLRRPRVAKIFGIDSEIGVAAVVNGKVEASDAIVAGPVPNLSIMPGGKRPTNPAEILSSERFANMINMLRDKFDLIVVDTPPLLAVSDPGAVAGIVDGVVMTMRLRRNVRPLATRAKSILESVGANLLGVVINGVSSEAGYGYNYDYNDYRYAYKYGSNYRSGYGYRYGYGNYRYGYTEDSDPADLSTNEKEDA